MHDIKLVADTPDALKAGRPGQKNGLCPDKGAEAPGLKTDRLSCLDEPYIPSRKEGSDASKTTNFRSCRRAVRRRHSRMNRFRRVLTRREKTSENDGTLLHFSCGLIVWNKVLLRQAIRLCPLIS
ncbi:transposase [Erwinia tracheiphila PSU-1]|nr:transposase [Erwinia tracheiphila PSU-1]